MITFYILKIDYYMSLNQWYICGSLGQITQRAGFLADKWELKYSCSVDVLS